MKSILIQKWTQFIMHLCKKNYVTVEDNGRVIVCSPTKYIEVPL